MILDSNMVYIDKTMMDNIEDPAKAMEMRKGLINFYSVLKEVDSLLQFVFLTGVSKFSKVNIFSGINNLVDLTLDESSATICGYTQKDLETSFAEHLVGVDREQLKLWYNGYNFLGESVYNPFDILLFIQKNHAFRNYWFETGTPTFLVKLMQKNRYFLPDMADDAGKQPGNSALAQIRAMGYADKYLGQAGVRVFELGLVFSMTKRNLVQFAGAERGSTTQNPPGFPQPG